MNAPGTHHKSHRAIIANPYHILEGQQIQRVKQSNKKMKTMIFLSPKFAHVGQKHACASLAQ
ncbi:unnamed protein product [Sphenostylis stenocarpa]|uniref:Uncharacterized protein n=1 Tax=Sphenostylis stenocarpa TaxID=92480 RepID=A0AA86VVY9_9FABA|nr:unnamed protein product [Sphenostylis stenocarpa]